jgi:hypothetical protein
MLMIILGVGASHDSTPRFRAGMGMPTDPRPPLADGLFASHFLGTLINLFPECRDLVPRLHTSVEETLQKFQAQAIYDSERYKQLMAVRHYVPRVVGDCEEWWLRTHGPITNHVGLLDSIRSWFTQQQGGRACFVTFNYDTFLEQAFSDTALKIRMRDLDEYIGNDTYKLIKLHGSVTWFREVESPAIADLERRSADQVLRELISLAKDIKLAKGFRVEN